MQINNQTENHQQTTQPSFQLHPSPPLETPLQQHCENEAIITKETNFNLCILEYSSQLKKYTLKGNQQSQTSQVKEIADLVLGDLKSHLKANGWIPNGEKISVSKVMKPIVMPIFGGKRFAFIFETQDYCNSGKSNYSTRDKFYIFLTQSFLPKTFSEFAKLINKKETERKLKSIKQEAAQKIVSADCSNIDLQQIMGEMTKFKKMYFSKEGQIEEEVQKQTNWYLRHVNEYSILIRLNTLHYRPILLLTLLIFYSIRQFKVILVGYKTTRHIMSQAIMALKHAYHPIPYCYPIIFSAVSEEHDNYIDSPVPALIACWGEERQCIKTRERFKKMSQQKLMPTILIDLNSLTALSSITTQYQSRILADMNSFITGDKQKGSVIRHANQYVLSLANSKHQDLQQQSTLFRKSLAFHQFTSNK